MDDIMRADGPAAVAGALSTDEVQKLTACEAIIARGLETFEAVGNALIVIRDGRLYRATHSSFETYVRQRWELGRSRAYQLIDAAKSISEIVDIPANESQARALSKVDPDKRQEAWDLAVASSLGGKLAASKVSAAARLLKENDAHDSKYAGLVEQVRAGAIPLPQALRAIERDEERVALEEKARLVEPESIVTAESGAAGSSAELLSAPDPWYDWSDSERGRREQAERGTTVLADQHRDSNLVRWARQEGRFVDISRSGWQPLDDGRWRPLANPMKPEWMDGDRAAVVAWYRDHWFPFVKDALRLDELRGGKVLGCWCPPGPCHGDVILEHLARPGAEVEAEAVTEPEAVATPATEVPSPGPEAAPT